MYFDGVGFLSVRRNKKTTPTLPIASSYQGLDFTGRTARCMPVAIHIGPKFCGDSANNPLGGSIPIRANASIVYPNDQLTAIVASTTYHSTVAFLGTGKGELKKVGRVRQMNIEQVWSTN